LDGLDKFMDLKSRFSASLNTQLLSYYRRIPSASILARDFNMRAQGSISPITQETARRWIRGLSMPEMDKLQILAQWLELDINLNLNPIPTGQEINPSQDRRKKTVSLNEVEAQLLQVFRETDVRGKRVLLAVARSLMQSDVI
jgi:hypothetical protein